MTEALAVTQRDREEMLRAANIVHRFATIKNSAALFAIASYLMLHVSESDEASASTAELERLVKLEKAGRTYRSGARRGTGMNLRPNPHRLARSLKLLRRVTKLRSDPNTPERELEAAEEILREHDDDARRRVDPRQLKPFPKA